MKQKSTVPTADVLHINTPYDIRDSFGERTFCTYIQRKIATGLKIESKSAFADGTPSNCTPYELGKVWDTILSKMIASPEIKLGQMLRNYTDNKSKAEDREAISNRLFEIAITDATGNIGMIKEVALIGIDMMLKDNLHDTNAMNIVSAMNNRAISTLKSPVALEKKSKVA